MTATPETIPWSRFVAIGDSLTEGVGDPVAGELRGWAERLAAHLRRLDPGLRFWNLARRSLTTREIRDAQLQAALDLEPDLVSAIVGMNDVMSRGFDREAFRKDLVALVAPLSETDATVVMGTLPRDVPLARLMPAKGRATVRRNLNNVSDVVIEVAGELGAVCVDAPEGWRYTMAECSIDGCHPNARGHAHIAELTLAALAQRAEMTMPSLARDGTAWLSSSFGHLRWLAAQGHLQLPTIIARLRRQEP
ncbi:MAG: SGNH/GDSL hydrolase family protein [Actinomycetota bacterium]